MEDPLVVFKALADATRLRLLRILLSGSFNVNELVGILGMVQSRVSRHLRILLEAGLVEARREGTWVYYRLAGDGWGEDGARAASSDDGSAGLFAVLGAILRRDAARERAGIDACLERRRAQSERFFRGVAAGWDRRRDRVQGAPGHIDRLLGLVGRCGTAVDLGTGTGVLLAGLAARARRVIGVDASPEMVAVARDGARAAKLSNVELRLGAVEHLPLADGDADCIVANMVLHHVSRPELALVEMRRALRSSGRLVIADFRRHRREDYRDKLGDLWLGFDPADLGRWLSAAGFALESLDDAPAERGRPAIFLAVARPRQPRRARSASRRAVRKPARVKS